MELNETGAEFTTISAEERAEEQKLIRRMQMMMNMVMQVIAQDSTLTVDDAAQMIADTRKAAWLCFQAKNSPTTLSGGPASNASCASVFVSCSRKLSFESVPTVKTFSFSTPV